MKTNLILVIVLSLFMGNTSFSQDFKYVGAAKCKMCHNTPAKGAQYTKWSESKHAKAMASLKGADATNPKCLKCHSTASSIDAKLNGGITVAEGVSCESCHGGGEKYKSPAIMKDLAQAKKNGLVIPDEKVCLGCHGKGLGNPNEKPFDYATYKAKIAHPNPSKK